jgi:hypothetical protein
MRRVAALAGLGELAFQALKLDAHLNTDARGHIGVCFQ